VAAAAHAFLQDGRGGGAVGLSQRAAAQRTTTYPDGSDSGGCARPLSAP
jgi:hypothetical protein